MRNKLYAILLALSFCMAPFIASAQQKYALLVGIDKYYDQPGVISPHSLHGCVNDANSMKALFINRFGYKPQNIKTLYDADASKKNVVAALMQMADQCKPGDAFVFYYSGHGVWAWDLDNNSDPVKRGMNQAMVMSDLYSESLSCLLTDAMIKKLFNRFVDKHVVLTSIFDCCYSGNLAMKPPLGHNAYTWPQIHIKEKSFPLNEVPFTQDGETLENVGDNIGFSPDVDYRVFQQLYDAADTAKWNAVAAIIEYAKNHPDDTAANAHANNIMNGFSLIHSYLLNHKEEDTTQEMQNFDFTDVVHAFALQEPGDSTLQTRSYNLQDAIRLFDPEVIPRPSERINSKFLSLSATTDVQKGLEIKDQNGNPHGAFTNALLTVYKNNPADIPISQLTLKIQAEMTKQRYRQASTFHAEHSRLSGNLLGILPSGFKNILTANCIAVKGNRVTIGLGSIAGITKGNYFKDAGSRDTVIMQVDSLTQLSAYGKITKGNPAAVKPGHSFLLVSDFIKAAPLVKIYVPAAAISYPAFNTLFTKHIRPLVEWYNYSDLKNFDNSVYPTYAIFFRDAIHTKPLGLSEVVSPENTFPFFLFLPIPAYVANPIINVLKKNPNVQLVSSQEKADYILCLTYAKDTTGKNGSFVFGLERFMDGEVSIGMPYDVYPWLADVKDMNITGNSLRKLTNDINNMAMDAARAKGKEKWLN